MARITPVATVKMDMDTAVHYAGMAFGAALMVLLFIREQERDEMLASIKRNTDQLSRGDA